MESGAYYGTNLIFIGESIRTQLGSALFRSSKYKLDHVGLFMPSLHLYVLFAVLSLSRAHRQCISGSDSCNDRKEAAYGIEPDAG